MIFNMLVLHPELHEEIDYTNLQENQYIVPHMPVRSRVLGCEENVNFERWNSRPHQPI